MDCPLPKDIWAVVIDMLLLPSNINDEKMMRESCNLILPLVSKQFNEICRPYRMSIWRPRSIKKCHLMRYYASMGYLSCLINARENGFNLDSACADAAAVSGDYNMLVYLIENECPIEYIPSLSDTVIRTGNLKNFEYICSKLGSPTETDLTRAIAHRQAHFLDYIFDNCKTKPYKDGLPAWIIIQDEKDSTNFVEYLHSKGIKGTPRSLIDGYTYFNMAVYEYTAKYGIEWHPEIFNICSKQNNLKCFQYAHEHGAIWKDNTCDMACTYGSVECLAYAHENGCGWDRQRCINSALNMLIEAANSYSEDDVGFSYGYLPPIYSDFGMVKCIQYVLVHEDKWRPNIELPSEYEQQKICKEYMLQRGIQNHASFDITKYFPNKTC